MNVSVRSQVAIALTLPEEPAVSVAPSPVMPSHFKVKTPIFLLSGQFDPVTGPRWGEQAASSLPYSLHVIAPGSHGVGGPCIDAIVEAFIEKGTITDIDTSCVETMDLGPFVLSEN